MGDWNLLVDEIESTHNTVENILKQEELKNQVGKVIQKDWNEVVSITGTERFIQALEENIAKYQGAMRSVFHGHMASNSRSLSLSFAKCAHPVLVEALTAIASRALVYQAWVRLVESEIVLGAARPDSILHLSLTWFLIMYPRFNLNENILYGPRIQLFVNFSNLAHASLAHGTKELMRMCLSQQPVSDLIQILLIDIDSWLGMKYPPMNPPQEPIPYEECVRSLCAEGFQDPDVEVEHRVHKLLRDPATRTDTALALISAVKYFLSSRYIVNDLQKKIGWCLNSLSNNIRPFPPPAPGIPHLLDNIELILQTWENKLNPFAKDHLTSLKQVLTHMFDQKIMQASFSEPKYDIEPARSSKSNVVKPKEPSKTELKEDFTLARPNTSRYHKEGYERVNPAVAKLAHVEDVWVQVEAVSLQPNGSSAFGKGNLLTSSTKGNLIFNMQQILWYASTQEGSKEPALAVKYERITQHTAGIIKPPPTDGVDQYYLSVHVLEVSALVYYFCPFTLNEVNELQRMLQDLCGKASTHEEEYSQTIVDQKINSHRVHLLRQLLQDQRLRSTVWISDMDSLDSVIKTLTSITINRSDDQYQYELERLFHSCRLNDEVAVETINNIRDQWETSPEAIHLRILAIIDRLLDRTLMHVDSPAFWALSTWLDHVEKTLNPYKNSKTLEIIYELKHRVQLLKKHTLVPLSLIDLQQYDDTVSVQ